VAAVLDEHEIDCSAVSRVWERSLLLTSTEPGVEGIEGGGVEWDDSFGVEFAEWHAQPTAGGAVVDDRVEFEFEQFADAETGAAQDRQRHASEGVVEVVDCGHQRLIDVGGECAREKRGLFGDVAGEHQSPRGCGPSPFGDVVEERAHADCCVSCDERSDSSVAVIASTSTRGGPPEERFDVAAFEVFDRVEFGERDGDELAEHCESRGELVDRLWSQHCRSGAELVEDGGTDLGRRNGGESAFPGEWSALSALCGRAVNEASFEQQLANAEQSRTAAVADRRCPRF